MILLPGDRKLYGKLPIIHIQYPYFITATKIGTHHDSNHKGGTYKNITNQNWILLDTCSTISSIRNKDLVHNIKPCDAGEELNK